MIILSFVNPSPLKALNIEYGCLLLGLIKNNNVGDHVIVAIITTYYSKQMCNYQIITQILQQHSPETTHTTILVL